VCFCKMIASITAMSLKPRRAHTLQRGKVCKTRQTFPLDSPVRVVAWGLAPYICARIISHHPSTQSPSRARLQGWPHGQQRALTGKRNKEKGIIIKDFFRSAYVRGLCQASFPNLGASVLLPVALWLVYGFLQEYLIKGTMPTAPPIMLPSALPGLCSGRATHRPQAAKRPTRGWQMRHNLRHKSSRIV